MVANPWAPDAADFAGAEPDWGELESRDKPGSSLRRRFEFDQQLQKRAIPMVSSIWWLPEWLYGDGGGKSTDGHRRIVPRDKWPQLARVIGSYLVYEKRRYGVEPDLFSFNESNAGVMVLMTAEEHRDIIIHIANLGPARQAQLDGLPGDVSRFRAVCTSPTDSFRELDPVENKGSGIELTLPARSLLTLTNSPK